MAFRKSSSSRTLLAMPTASTGVEIPLPPRHLRLMGDDDERFLEVGGNLVRLLYRLGLRDDSRLLDVGCSVGRLPIALLSGSDFHGWYVGFDVTPKQVQWARTKLQPVSPSLHFRLVDVRNDRYNPGGTVEPQDLRFPARSGGFDMACLFSIFTHFYKEDIQLYLHELRRCLKPGGTVVATWFLYDDARYDAAVNSIYPMVHRLDDDTIYSDPDDPLRAIAFRESTMRAMIAAAGLEVVTIEYGTWAGGDGVEFQDVVVLRRPVEPAPTRPAQPATAAQRVRRRLGALKRRLLRR